MQPKRIAARKRSSNPKKQNLESTAVRRAGFAGAKWLVSILSLVSIVSLAVAVYSSNTLRSSMVALTDQKNQLEAMDKQATISFDEWSEQFELFMVKMARRTHPARDLSTPKGNYYRVFYGLIENPYFRDAFPTRTAAAYYRLGQLHVLDGNFTSAIEMLQKSIDTAEQQSFQEQIALSRNTLGCVLAGLGDHKSAFQEFRTCLSVARDSYISSNSLAIIYQNIGLMQKAIGGDGVRAVSEAISLLEQDAEDGDVSIASEMLSDTYMTLCDMHWSRRKFEDALAACRNARDIVQAILDDVRVASLDSDFAAINRYVNAIRYTERNLTQLKKLSETPAADSKKFDTSGAFQWKRLVDLKTELVPDGVSLTATMHGEFQQQSGLVLAWGMFDWTHDVVTEVILNTHKNVQLVVLVDNDESLEEAKSSLSAAGVPIEKIRFSVCDYEAPWFRDVGPLVGETRAGDWLWFDSVLTREKSNSREVSDALPRIIRRHWDTRVVETKLDIEGGSVLSNGKGFTICSTKVSVFNREFGFSDPQIDEELKRITGAKEVAFLTPLVTEKSGHVDMFATFTDPNTIVLAESADAQDPNHKVLEMNAAKLGRVASRFDLNIERIPSPRTMDETCLTYTNVIYANGVLLVPSYGIPTDADAESTYQRLLPDWEVKMIDCSQVIAKGGALHCLVSNLGNTPYTPMPVRIRGQSEVLRNANL